MKVSRSFAALLLLAAVALAGFGLAALVAALEGRPIELGREKTLALEPALAERFAALDGDCHATYYVTSRERMPSELRRLEADVVDVLAEIAAASDGRFDFDVVDPADEPELSAWIAHQGIAPFRARSVRHDAWSEAEIHSTLALAWAGRGRARIEGLRPEHLPDLADLIGAYLDEIAEPSAPRIAIAGPHTRALAERAERDATVSRIDFEADPTALGSDVDLFVWIDPERAGAEHVRALEVFVEDGGSVVLAGSAHRLSLDAETRPPRISRSADPSPIESVAAEFGLQAAPDLVCDPSGGRFQLDGESWEAPWRGRSVAPNQDFRPLEEQPNGTLFFDSPTAWRFDSARLDELGFDAHTLATSSEDAWMQPLDAPTPVDRLTPENGRPTGKTALAVLLLPRDPWRGRLVVFGSAAPFQDEEFSNADFAHGPLAEALIASLGSTERRVLRRSSQRARPPLPALEPGTRILWRIATILALPLVLAIVALGRLRRANTRRRGERGLARGPVAVVALCVVAALAIGFASRMRGLDRLRFDWTRESVHELAPATRALAAELGRTVQGELAFSSPLPPELRAGLARLRGRLADLERAGLDLDVTSISVDDLAADERQALEAREIRPLRVARRAEDATSVRTLYATLALSAGETRTVLEFPNELAFDRLEFRLAVALWTLGHGRAPRIAIAADLPRLTPAEAHVEYRQKGLFAPSGTDVFGLAKEFLRLTGFDVEHVDPRRAELFAPDDRPDLLIWMQPRRDIGPMFAVVVDHLRAGGSVLLATQHFVMQSRQPQDAGLAVRHWPEPQYTDLETGWLADLGVLLERSVLFDSLRGSIAVTTRVERADGSSARGRGESTQPYLIRAVAQNATADPIVANLGDLLFASGSRLVLDDARLAATGLTARALARTSADAWAFDWTGGDLPTDVLAGPEPGGRRTPNAVLVALVEGSFPPLERDVFVGPSAGGPGRLAICGASKPFENELLFAPDYDHASLFANLVADLALGPELGAVCARRSTPQGFEPPSDSTRLALRATVLGAAPLVFLVLGLARRARGQRNRTEHR